VAISCLTLPGTPARSAQTIVHVAVATVPIGLRWLRLPTRLIPSAILRMRRWSARLPVLLSNSQVNGLPVGSIGGTGANPISRRLLGSPDTGALVVDNIQLIQTGNTVPTPTQEELIWQANFEHHLSQWQCGLRLSVSRWLRQCHRNSDDKHRGRSRGRELARIHGRPRFLEQHVHPSSYSGFGVGATEKFRFPSCLTSSNKASYRVYLAAEAGGLASRSQHQHSGGAGLAVPGSAGRRVPGKHNSPAGRAGPGSGPDADDQLAVIRF
jgi:hypothetical protein